MAEIYSGLVHSIRYSDGDFNILSVRLDETDSFEFAAVKGNFPAQIIEVGAWISFEGKWVKDARYGDQLQVTRSPVALQNWSDERVLSALSANGVGVSLREHLKDHVDYEGVTVFELLNGGKLSSVRGLDDFAQTFILGRWASIRTHLDAMEFMANAGIPTKIVSEIWKLFGTDIEAKLLEDPWVLVQVPGVTFKEVDDIAIRLGVPLTNPGRIRGAILASLQDAYEEGHVFVSVADLIGNLHEKIPETSTTAALIVQAIQGLKDANAVVVDRETSSEVKALYLPWYYEMETFCATTLKARVEEGLDAQLLRNQLLRVGDRVRQAEEDGADVRGMAKAALENWAEGRKTALSAPQMEAALNALTGTISLLTGLPGTGKTTTLRAVVSVIQDAGIPLLLIAPTGIAAKRMASVTGHPAHTIHRALGAKKSAAAARNGEEERESNYHGIVGDAKRKGLEGGSGTWEFGPGNYYPAQFVIVDESSMLDLHMLYRVLKATSPTCRILFVGDPYQLPSVGAGDVLRDLVKSKVFAHSHLTTIFRQGELSGIIQAAHSVHNGIPPKPDGKDFLFSEAATEEDAADEIVKIAKKLYKERKNFQVLSPRHAGDAGVTTLNQRLRLTLNPAVSGLAEMRIGGNVVREGDRVMVVKNDYEQSVYNGDVGKVSRVDIAARRIEIKIFEGPDESPRIVSYPFKEASKVLRLAYAQTVHKSQGQEYDYIILPVMTSFGRQLQRNLFYTAITRAKAKVILVGSAEAIAKAVRNNASAKRNTLLDVRLASG